MTDDAWLAKLDPSLRNLVEHAAASGENEWVSLLLQVSGPVGDLVSHGLSIGNQAGDVLMAQAPLSAVPRIARHHSVVAIEVSRGLHPDG